ncbi:MAG: glycosyltransferase [Pseudomonadota bacterium]
MERPADGRVLPVLSIVIPANNEADYIGSCLDALLSQNRVEAPVEVIVAANACSDGTVEIVRGFGPRFESLGWSLVLLDLQEPGKPNALNSADAVASYPGRLYLDADVVMMPDLLAEICRALADDKPVYCGGRLIVAPATSWMTRRYSEVWSRLPFMTSSGVTGAGLFAVNAEARKRWAVFPEIISDDTYVRLHFSPEERIALSSGYLWPMVEGFSALVKVRRRQDAGLAEIAQKYPQLLANDGTRKMRFFDHLSLFSSSPISYLIYVGVALAVRSREPEKAWTRGR